MPFNKLHVPTGTPAETCHRISDELHESLVNTCGVNAEDDFSLVCRYDPDDMLFHPTFLGVRNPANTIVIEITLLEGRTEEQKEALYQDVRRRLGELGLDPSSSIVFLNENRAIDWSFGPEGSVKHVLGL
ncbi:MAG: tautomerase family protein [Actinomycetota bacterium]